MKISKNKLKEIIRETLTENKEYEQFFQTALDRAGKSIPDMSDDEKKSFFDKIDTAWNGRGEKKEVSEESDSSSADFQEFFKRSLEKAGKSITSMTPDEKEKFFNQIDASWNGKGEKKEVGEAMDGECDTCNKPMEEPECEDCGKNMNEGFFDMFKKKSIDDEELGKKILQKLQHIKASDVQKTYISGSLYTYIDNTTIRCMRKNNTIEIGNDDDILKISNNLRNSICAILTQKYKEFERQKKVEADTISNSKGALRDKRVDNIKKKLGEAVFVMDERPYGKNGLIIMIQDSGKSISAIFKNKKNADKFNRNDVSDINKLSQLAKKLPFGKAIDESKLNEDTSKIAQISHNTGVRTTAIEKFIKDNNLNDAEINSYLQKGNLRSRLDFAYAVTGKPNNKFSQFFIKKFKLSESTLNERGEYTNQTGIKSSIARVREFVNLIGDSRIIRWILDDKVKLYKWSEGGVIFTDGKHEVMVDIKHPMQLLIPMSPVRQKIKALYNNKTENVNEADTNDDTLMLKIGGEKGQYWPWYFQKIDSTHFKMANNEKALSTGAAMVHHVGQHRGETYYNDLVKWLHGSLKSKQLSGKEYKGNG